MPGVEFGWVKFTSSSRFLPAFIYPLEHNASKRKAQQLLANGKNVDDAICLLDSKKYEIKAIATPSQVAETKKIAKTKPYLAAIKQFNILNNTKFEWCTYTRKLSYVRIFYKRITKYLNTFFCGPKFIDVKYK